MAGGRTPVRSHSAISQTVAQRFPTISPERIGSPDIVAVRHWFNPNLIYRWFIVPSLSGILTMFAALVITCRCPSRVSARWARLTSCWFRRQLRQKSLLPRPVPALVIGTLMGNVMVAAGVFLFRIPFTGSYFPLLLTMLLFILSVVGIGLMISSICATQQQAILGVFAFGVPMILISGFATPIENMPLVSAVAFRAGATAPLSVIVQGTFLKALPWRDVFAHLWPMAVISAVSLWIATASRASFTMGNRSGHGSGRNMSRQLFGAP